MIKATFSNSFKAKQKRIKNLPTLIDSALKGVYKKDSAGIIKEYQNGIRTNSLGLERLKPKTIQSKRSKGTSKPSVPLYAWGDDQKMSLINCLRIKPLKNGWKIAPSKGMHHTKDGGQPISLEFLHRIHEYGAIIPNGKKASKRVKRLFGKKWEPIRILPRPALTRAYRNYLAKLRNNKKETSRTVQLAIQSYIANANRVELDNLIAYNKRYKELEKA